MDKRAFIDRVRSNFPDKLIELDQWVCWRVETRDGDPTKVPYAINGLRAESDNPATWAKFDEVCAAYLSGNYAGVGFMFSEHDPYAGIDFDKCVDGQEIDPRRAGWMRQLDSYSEYSQSKTGIHTIVIGHLPPGRRKSRELNVEMYDRLRFFVVTGDHVPGTPLSLNERQAELEALHIEVFGRPKEKKPQTAQGNGSADIPADDQELLRLMFASKNGTQVESLWRGNVNAYNGDHSAADLALCNYLAFWTGNDAERIDRMFRMSDLARDKWDRNARTGETYGEGTVARAIAATTQTYSSRRAYANGHGKNDAEQQPPPEPDDWTPGELPPVTAKKTATTDHQFDVLKYRSEDGGILDAWLDVHGQDWIFSVGHDRWYHWNKTHWALDDSLQLGETIQDLTDYMNRECSRIMRETPDRIKAIIDKFSGIGVSIPDKTVEEIERLKTGMEVAKSLHKATKRSSHRIHSVDDMARKKRKAATPRFNAMESLNLSNGTLDLRSLELLPHDPDDLCTYCLDYAYDPKADCPRFKKFLREVLVVEGTLEPDEALISLLQELFGYSLTTQTKHQVMAWMTGEGGNGKSVVIAIIKALLGSMAVSIDFQTLGTTGNYDMADIPGARVLFSLESEKGVGISEKHIKSIVTGDPMKTRPIYGSPMEFVSTAKIWWSMNDKPVIKDTTNAIWRRLKLIPFYRTFEEGKGADPNLTDALLKELSGILNWAIEGLIRLSNSGVFTGSETANVAKEQYREQSNPVAQWSSTMAVRTDYPATLQAALYASFKGWCIENGERMITSTQFGLDMKRLKIDKARRGAGWMYHLALVETHKNV